MTGSDLPGFAFTRLVLADPGKIAVKILTRSPDGSITSFEYDNGREWRLHPFDVGDDFDAMARALRRLAARKKTILVVGAPRSGLDLTIPRRRLSARGDPLGRNTLVAVPRAVLVIDVDDATVPDGLGDPLRFVEAAIWLRDNLLPPEFHGATMVVSPSAKTGLRGPRLLRVRLWFLLDRAHELSALHDWMRGLKLATGIGDYRICLPGQVIYVGRPIFLNMPDPIPPEMWAVLVRGSCDRVALNADRYVPAVIVLDRKLAAATVAAGDDWRRFLRDTVGGETSFYEPLSRGLGLAAQSNESADAILAFTVKLIGERADRGRIAQYDADWVRRSITRFRTMDKSARARREVKLAQLYGEIP